MYYKLYSLELYSLDLSKLTINQWYNTYTKPLGSNSSLYLLLEDTGTFLSAYKAPLKHIPFPVSKDFSNILI